MAIVTNYAQMYIDAMKKGDLTTAQQALIDRQNKINSQGITAVQSNADLIKQYSNEYNKSVKSQAENDYNKQLQDVKTNYEKQLGGLQSQLQPNQDYSTLINQLTETKKKQALTGLEQAKQNALSGLSEQELTIKPAYEGQRSGLRQQSEMQAKDFENFLANKGLSTSGISSQGEIARNVTLQSGISSLQLAQQKALENIAKQRQQTEQEYQRELISATSQAEQNAIERLLAQAQTQEQRRYQEQQNAIARSEELANQQKQSELDTLGRYSNNFQAEINRRQQNPDATDDWLIPYLQQARQQKIQEQGLDPETGAKLPTLPTTKLTVNEAMNLWERLGTATPEIASVLGIQQGSQTQTISQQKAYDNALSKWTKGIPLNASEMGLLGVTTLTKPKETKETSSGASTVKPLW